MRPGLAIAAAALALGLSVHATEARAGRLQLPRADVAPAGGGPALVEGAPAASLPAVARLGWGGVHTTSTGDRVTVRVSDAYPVDGAVGEAWAEFLAGLLHGPELALVTLYLAPPDEVRLVCRSPFASGCYSPSRALIVAIGEDEPGRVTAEEVVRHEYGHHVAFNRRNPPWNAGEWGPKRWATHAQVCPRVERGTAYPGDQGARYRLNPGEAFAEAYRMADERRAGVPSSSWSVVDGSFFPDSAALDAVVTDTAEPWQGPRITAVTGQPGAVRYVRLAAPYDGELTISLTAARGSAYGLGLYSPGFGRTYAETAPARQATVRTVVCGRRSFVVGVFRARGSGAFRLRASVP